MRKVGGASRHRCGGDVIYALLSGCERSVTHAAVALGLVNRVSLLRRVSHANAGCCLITDVEVMQSMNASLYMPQSPGD
jgi:hypothetical protein